MCAWDGRLRAMPRKHVHGASGASGVSAVPPWDVGAAWLERVQLGHMPQREAIVVEEEGGGQSFQTSKGAPEVYMTW